MGFYGLNNAVPFAKLKKMTKKQAKKRFF